MPDSCCCQIVYRLRCMRGQKCRNRFQFHKNTFYNHIRYVVSDNKTVFIPYLNWNLRLHIHPSLKETMGQGIFINFLQIRFT